MNYLKLIMAALLLACLLHMPYGFYVLVRTYSVLFRIGAAIELQRLGYTIKRVM